MSFCVSVFNASDKAWAAKSSELEDHGRQSSDFPSVSIYTKTIQDQCYQLNASPPALMEFIRLAEAVSGCCSWNPLNSLPKAWGSPCCLTARQHHACLKKLQVSRRGQTVDQLSSELLSNSTTLWYYSSPVL